MIRFILLVILVPIAILDILLVIACAKLEKERDDYRD